VELHGDLNSRFRGAVDKALGAFDRVLYDHVEVTFMGSLSLLALVFFGRDLGRRLLEKAKDFKVTFNHHNVWHFINTIILSLCPNPERIFVEDEGAVGACCDLVVCCFESFTPPSICIFKPGCFHLIRSEAYLLHEKLALSNGFSL